MKPCWNSPYVYFGGTCRLQFKPSSLSALCWFLASLIHWSWRWGRYILRNVGWLSTDYTALYTRRENPSRFIRLSDEYMELSWPSRPTCLFLNFRNVVHTAGVGALYLTLYYCCRAVRKCHTWSQFLNSIQQNIICACFVRFTYLKIANYGTS
jgi:hypothetical protein